MTGSTAPSPSSPSHRAANLQLRRLRGEGAHHHPVPGLFRTFLGRGHGEKRGGRIEDGRGLQGHDGIGGKREGRGGEGRRTSLALKDGRKTGQLHSVRMIARYRVEEAFLGGSVGGGLCACISHGRLVSLACGDSQEREDKVRQRESCIAASKYILNCTLNISPYRAPQPGVAFFFVGLNALISKSPLILPTEKSLQSSFSFGMFAFGYLSIEMRNFHNTQQ